MRSILTFLGAIITGSLLFLLVGVISFILPARSNQFDISGNFEIFVASLLTLIAGLTYPVLRFGYKVSGYPLRFAAGLILFFVAVLALGLDSWFSLALKKQQTTQLMAFGALLVAGYLFNRHFVFLANQSAGMPGAFHKSDRYASIACAALLAGLLVVPVLSVSADMLARRMPRELVIEEPGIGNSPRLVDVDMGSLRSQEPVSLTGCGSRFTSRPYVRIHGRNIGRISLVAKEAHDWAKGAYGIEAVLRDGTRLCANHGGDIDLQGLNTDAKYVDIWIVLRVEAQIDPTLNLTLAICARDTACRS